MDINPDKYNHFLLPGDHDDDESNNLKKVVNDGKNDFLTDF